MGRRKSFAEVAGNGALEVTDAPQQSPSTLPVKELTYRPVNPRQSSEYTAADIDGMAASMEYVGVLQPIAVVRREIYAANHSEEAQHLPEAATWVVMYGNRRLAAARKAGLTEVPVYVQDRVDEDDKTRESVLIENIHHSPLAALEEAYEVEALVTRHGTRSAVAKILGKSGGWVTQRLNLINLQPPFQAELTAGTLTIEHARALGAIPAERQQQAWEAGPPYRDPAKQPVVKPAEPVPEAATEEATAKQALYAVKTEPTAGSEEGAASPELYAVKTEERTTATDVPATAASGTAEETVRVSLHPQKLAQLIKKRLSAEQRAELVRLLQG